MATTDFDYIQTRDEIIEGAFRIIGALSLGQVLTAEMQSQGVSVLNLLIKSWSNEHLFSWSFDETSFVTVADQEAYVSPALDVTIIGLDKAWVVDSNTDIQQYMEVISYSRYEDIRNKETSSGVPTHIAYKATPEPSFYLWPSPDAVYTVKALAVFPLKDLANESDSGDIPVRWQRALKYALAEDLFDEYPGPINEKQLIALKAANLFQKAKNGDRPQETTSEVESLFPMRRC